MELAVLWDDSQSCDLVVGSCFDQKPFYMIFRYIPEVSWEVKTKKVWSWALKREIHEGIGCHGALHRGVLGLDGVFPSKACVH